MSKHIHVHVHRALDAESTKHDPKNGQFTTGAAGGNAMHHHKQAKFHMAERDRKGMSHPDGPYHAQAMVAHGKARNALEYAASSTGSQARAQRMGEAQASANEAAKHEATLAAGERPGDKEKKAAFEAKQAVKTK